MEYVGDRHISSLFIIGGGIVNRMRGWSTYIILIYYMSTSALFATVQHDTVRRLLHAAVQYSTA